MQGLHVRVNLATGEKHVRVPVPMVSSVAGGAGDTQHSAGVPSPPLGAGLSESQATAMLHVLQSLPVPEPEVQGVLCRS